MSGDYRLLLRRSAAAFLAFALAFGATYTARTLLGADDGSTVRCADRECNAT